MSTSPDVADVLNKTPLWVRDTGSEEETLALARSLGTQLKPGDWIALTGDLGTGKTVFVRGLGEALRCRGPFRSCTFVIFQTYPSHGNKGPALHHVDLYRLSPAEIGALDWQEALSGAAVTVVEWADKARAYWPPTCVAVRLSQLNEPNRRRLEFFAVGDRGVSMIQKLKKGK
jgi:tRNA threonylcarbamoyladenosine biosynthesis protein TsaE